MQIQKSTRLRTFNPPPWLLPVLIIAATILGVIFVKSQPVHSSSKETESSTVVTIQLSGKEQMTDMVPPAFYKPMVGNFSLLGQQIGGKCKIHIKKDSKNILSDSFDNCKTMQDLLTSISNHLSNAEYREAAEALSDLLRSFNSFTPPPAMP